MKKHTQTEAQLDELCKDLQKDWNAKQWEINVRLFLSVYSTAYCYFMITESLASARSMDYEET